MSESHEFTFDVAQVIRAHPASCGSRYSRSSRPRRILMCADRSTMSSAARHQCEASAPRKHSHASLTAFRSINSTEPWQCRRTNGNAWLFKASANSSSARAPKRCPRKPKVTEEPRPPSRLISCPSPAGSPTISGTGKANREQLYTPDEPDDDDLYFQERRNNGWLQ